MIRSHMMRGTCLLALTAAAACGGDKTTIRATADSDLARDLALAGAQPVQPTFQDTAIAPAPTQAGRAKQEPPAPESVKVDLDSDLRELDMTRALKLSLERERDSESYFRFMAERAPDTVLGTLFMELADHDEALVGARIWTEAGHIDQKLSDLTAHLENVIQKYLRDRFPTIMDYNAQAGEVASAMAVERSISCATVSRIHSNRGLIAKARS